MSKTITVNGTERPIPSDPRVSLLDFLRENEGLTGTKKGCDHGQCGACTVIVNGINAIIAIAVWSDKLRIRNMRGFSDRLGCLLSRCCHFLAVAALLVHWCMVIMVLL